MAGESNCSAVSIAFAKSFRVKSHASIINRIPFASIFHSTSRTRATLHPHAHQADRKNRQNSNENISFFFHPKHENKKFFDIERQRRKNIVNILSSTLLSIFIPPGPISPPHSAPKPHVGRSAEPSEIA